MADFDLSSKDAVINVGVSFSIKHKAKEGTSEKLHSFLEDLNKLIEKHSSDEVLFKTSIENVLTHKQKKAK